MVCVLSQRLENVSVSYVLPVLSTNRIINFDVFKIDKITFTSISPTYKKEVTNYFLLIDTD